jgi:putative ABC transport system permease protein
MSVLWHKVWFDLWHNKGRTALAVLSIAAGVFAVGAIFGLVDQLLSSMDAAHRAVAPSHINIILRDLVDPAAVEGLKGIDGVIDIDPVNQLSVRYKRAAGDEWALGTLVMRPDYEVQTFDQLVLRDGDWPSGNELAVERLTGPHFDLSPGQEVLFEIGGREQAFGLNGVVRHPFVQPPPFGGQAHFFADAAGLAAFGIPEGLYGQLLVQVEPYSLERAHAVAGDIRSTLADRGVGVVVTLYQEPAEHWGRMFVEGINLVLQIMAVVALVMSVILVLNALTALITQQTDQIGIIKATGGGRWTIVRVYLAGVLVYGLLALLISLPLALLFAWGMSRWFLNLFNIELAAFQYSTTAVALQVAAALLAPLLAALWPVLKGARLTVREAMASYGLGADFGGSVVDRLVERLGAAVLPASYASALGNVFRRKGRLALTVLALVVAGTMFLVVASLISSTHLTLDNEMARQRHDFRIGFSQEQPIDDVLAIVGDSGRAAEAEMWYSRNATILRQGERLQDSAGLGAQLVGIPEGSTMYRPIIAAGRWLAPGDGQAVVISQATATANDIAAGDTIALDLGDLGAAEWQVIGTYRVVYGSGFVTEPIYAPLAAVQASTGRAGVGSQLLVRADLPDGAGLEESTAAADALNDLLRERGLAIDFYTTSVKLQERAYANNQFNSVISMLLSLAVLAAAVGGIGLMGALGISVVERTREIGVMRALGAGSGTITGLFILEGVLQGLLSWLAAVPLALVLARPLARQLGRTMIEVDLDFAFAWPAVGAWLAIILVIALLASIVPARRAAGISVRESLAYG